MLDANKENDRIKMLQYGEAKQIVEQIEIEVRKLSDDYKNKSENHYDFWKEHIKLVYEEAIELAKQNNADEEIVRLAALLHDIALIKKVGTKADHHINGKIIAEEMLTKFSYPKEKMERVLKCIYNHRSSKNAESIEELCVADADILSHFDNIPMLFSLAYNENNVSIDDVRKLLKEYFQKDFNDLSDKTKKEFEEKYKQIYQIVIGNA